MSSDIQQADEANSSSNENDSKMNDSDDQKLENNSFKRDKLKEFESKLEENEKIRKYSKGHSGGAGTGTNGTDGIDEKKMGRQSSAPNIRTSVHIESKSNDDNNNNNFSFPAAKAPKVDEKNENKINNKYTAENSDDNKTPSESDNINDAKMLALQRATSMPPIAYDPCREFDNFAGDWVDSKGQPVIISAWGVIRYPNNPKLRFEAVHMGPNHLSVTFDRDPKKRKFVGKLNHDCNVLIWSNDTKWTRKGAKHNKKTSKDFNISTGSIHSNSSSGKNGNHSDSSESDANSSNNSTPKTSISKQTSCIVM